VLIVAPREAEAALERLREAGETACRLGVAVEGEGVAFV